MFLLVAHLKEESPGSWFGKEDKCNSSLLGINTQQLRTEVNMLRVKWRFSSRISSPFFLCLVYGQFPFIILIILPSSCSIKNKYC